MLANLSDWELAVLQITPKVRTVPGHWMVSRFFTNWPDQVDFAQAPPPDEDPANQAIRSIGAEALPYLAAGLRSRESKLQNLFCRWVWPRLPGQLQVRIGRPIHPIHKRVNAAYAFRLLGSAARSGLADLQRVAKEDEDALVRAVAFESWHRIDPASAGPFYPELFDPPGSSATGTNVLRTNLTEVFDHSVSIRSRRGTVDEPIAVLQATP
jgi:hypothetical protein